MRQKMQQNTARLLPGQNLGQSSLFCQPHQPHKCNRARKANRVRKASPVRRFPTSLEHQINLHTRRCPHSLDRRDRRDRRAGLHPGLLRA